jgi:hypothetical protein
MSTLKLYDIVGSTEYQTDAVRARPDWAGTRIKTTKLFQDLIVDNAKNTVFAYARDLVIEPLAVMYDVFVQRNGPRPKADGLEQQEWDSGLDDEVAAILEPYSGIVSINWLGQHTVDTLLHQPGEIQKLAEGFAREVWGQASYHKTNNQLMAALGFVQADMDNVLPVPTTTPATKGTEAMSSLVEVLNSIMLNYTMGLIGDESVLTDNLDQASDTDDTLMEGAAGRLFIDPSSALLLRVARANGLTVEKMASVVVSGMMLDDKAAAVILAPATPAAPVVEEVEGIPEILKRSEVPPPPVTVMVTDTKGNATVSKVPSPPNLVNINPLAHVQQGKVPPPPAASATRVPPPPPVSGGGAAASTPPAAKRKKSDPPPAGHIPQHVLQTIKEATQLKDDDLAVLFGVSRPTMNNYLRGKGYCTPTPEQRKAVAARIEAKANALVEALQLLTS